MTSLRARLVLALALAVVLAPPALAGAPTDQLRSQVDRVIKTLEDSQLKDEAKTLERRKMVRRIADEIFDFGETAKRSLGRHWQARTPAEREEFVQLFADLLERSYISKIELFNGERVTYIGETVDDATATVRTRLLTKQGTEIPVDYRMLKRGERWLVYDVIIEGVSLVANYRTQFNKIIQTSSYPDLIKRLKGKQEELLGSEKKRS